MSWHFSRALVEEYSAASSSDGEPSAPSSGSPTPQAFLSPDRMTAFSRLSRFGMTFGHLTDDLGTDLLTWFREASLARTSVPQVEGPGLMGSVRGSGAKWRESLAKYDPDSRSWKTRQCSLLGDLEPFSGTWPRWGMMRNGAFWERMTPALPTFESGSGFWQTPVSDDAVNREIGKWNSRGEPKLSAQVLYPTPTASEYGTNQGGAAGRTGPVRPSLSTMARNWPTPLSADGGKHSPAVRHKGGNHTLTSAVATWPTPKANDAEKRGDFDETNPRNGLPAAVKAGGPSTPPTYPTPTKAGGLGGPGSSGRQGGENLRTNIGGQLNPEWVEWLMGWPLGWTDLKPLETAKFRQWLDSHGEP